MDHDPGRLLNGVQTGRVGRLRSRFGGAEPAERGRTSLMQQCLARTRFVFSFKPLRHAPLSSRRQLEHPLRDLAESGNRAFANVPVPAVGDTPGRARAPARHRRWPSTAPAPAGSNRCSRSAELSRQGPLVHPELARHERERRALVVPCRGPGDGLIGHLADHAPSSNAGPVEVVEDGGPVDVVPTGECADRGTLSVQRDELFDLRCPEPALDRV